MYVGYHVTDIQLFILKWHGRWLVQLKISMRVTGQIVDALLNWLPAK